MNKKNLLFFVVTLFCAVFSLFVILNVRQIETFAIVYVSSSLLFLLMVYLISKTEITTKEIIALVLVGVLLRLSFIDTNPVGSDDIYRYMWDGKIQANGINPYSYSANDASLQKLHTTILPSLVNFPEMKTIYFPLSQWLFYIGYQLSGENVWGYKLLLLFFELLTIYLLFRLTKKLGLPYRYILFYALCPLPIIHFAIDAHLDGFGLPLLIMSIFLYLKDKKIISLIFLGLSFSIKPVGLLLVPIFFLNEKKFTDKIKVIVIPFAAFFVQFIPYIFSSNPFEMFFVYTKNWSFNGIIFNLLNAFVHNSQTTRLICAALMIVVLIPLFFSKKEWIDKFYYSIILLFVFSPVVHPWYITWLAILLPIFPRWSGFALISLSSLTVFTVLNYLVNGAWKEYSFVLILEYIPVFVLVISELTKRRVKNYLGNFC